MKSLDTGCFGTPRKMSLESEPVSSTHKQEDSLLLSESNHARQRLVETEVQNRFSEFMLPSEDMDNNSKDEMVKLDALNVINMEAEVKVS